MVSDYSNCQPPSVRPPTVRPKGPNSQVQLYKPCCVLAILSFLHPFLLSIIMSKANHNNSTIVKNVNGTSKQRYKINNLHNKYVASGGTNSATCQAKGCSNPATATAHVRLTDGRKSDNWQFTRFCAIHNSSHHKEEIALRKNAKLVSLSEVRNS